MFDIGMVEDPAGMSEEQIRKELEVLFPSAVVRAQRRAINRTITSTRTFISKMVREDLALKAKTVKDSLTIKRASRGTNPVGKIDVQAKPISLKRYGARTTRKGVTVKVTKSGGRKVVKGGFIPGRLGGHVFKRKSKSRLPIGKRFGPSVNKEVEQNEEKVINHIDKTFPDRLRNQINWEIERSRR